MILLSPSSKVIWSSPHRVKDGLIWQPLTAPPLGNLVGEVVEGYAMHATSSRPDVHLPPSDVGERPPPPPLLNLQTHSVPGRFHLDRYTYGHVGIQS